MNTLKDFEEKHVFDKPVMNTIQLLYNPKEEPRLDSEKYEKIIYIRESVKEPKVPFLIIPTINDVKFEGDFDFIVFAKSPNYTPASADYIIEIFKEYIDEI